jgi:hypothetical protein
LLLLSPHSSCCSRLRARCRLLLLMLLPMWRWLPLLPTLSLLARLLRLLDLQFEARNVFPEIGHLLPAPCRSGRPSGLGRPMTFFSRTSASASGLWRSTMKEYTVVLPPVRGVTLGVWAKVGVEVWTIRIRLWNPFPGGLTVAHHCAVKLCPHTNVFVPLLLLLRG